MEKQEWSELILLNDIQDNLKKIEIRFEEDSLLNYIIKLIEPENSKNKE